MNNIFTSDLHFSHRLCAITRGYFDDIDEVMKYKQSSGNDIQLAGMLNQLVISMTKSGKISTSDYNDHINKMNNDIIDKFNSKATDNDIVYILGDILFGKEDTLPSFINRLNGKEIHLIIGNHDSNKIINSNLWTSVQDRKHIRIDGVDYYLDHYPLATWDKAHYGSINLHGHCHNTYKISSQQIDVGVDTNDCYPYTLDELINKMNKAPKFIVPDFH